MHQNIEPGKVVQLSPGETIEAVKRIKTLREIEREAIESSMVRHGGKRIAVATELGIAPRTLYDKLKLYSADGDQK